MMRNRPLVVVALLALVWQDSYARCIAASNIQAQVAVFGCSKVTFENIRVSHPPVSGALLDVSVQGSEVVGDDPGIPAGKGPPPWKKGENRSLFVAGEAAEICRQAWALPFPHPLFVYAPVRCCDTGECDVPVSITPVKIITK